jgi:hypothetical protein
MHSRRALGLNFQVQSIALEVQRGSYASGNRARSLIGCLMASLSFVILADAEIQIGGFLKRGLSVLLGHFVH